MRSFRQIILFILAGLMVATAAPVTAEVLPTDAERLVIETGAGPVAFSVELALTPDDRASGLMNRQSMAADHGMLFKFEQTRPILMWMKNTPLSLDMLFIDANGKVVGIAKETTPFSEAIIPSPEPVRYVLELNGGTADEQGISVGDTARHRVIGQ